MADRDQIEKFMQADYLPTGQQISTDERIAKALEYIAYHMGQIDKRMDKLNEMVFRINR